MRISVFFLVTRLPLLLSVNCATFGVEAEDHVLTSNADAQGVTRFEVADMPTHEGMYIIGGSDRFNGEMHVTGWFSEGEEHDIFDYLGLAFDREDDSLSPYTLFHSEEAEHITVRQVRFDVPRELDVSVLRADGGLAIDNIAGVVEVRAANGYVRVSNTDDEVKIDGAGTVELDNTGRVEVAVAGSVYGNVMRGGWIDAEGGGIDIDVPGQDFERLSLTSDLGCIEIDLPSSGGYTLDIEAGYAVGEKEDAEPGQVTIDVGDVFVDHEGYLAEVYEVNGGGPLIVVRDAHTLEIR